MTRPPLLPLALVALVTGAAAGAPAAPPPPPPRSEALTQTLYLSGRGTDDAVPWKFQITAGMRANQPATIPVPWCWELQGFGAYAYGHDKVQPDEKGLYERAFDLPAGWAGRRVFLVFDGVMTDAAVKVNGQSAGPIHQGAFYRFQYDITPLVKFGAANTLEVTVSKESANPSVNAAERRGDYWNYGGIFRPVYLLAQPQQFIERPAINARADGSFALSVQVNGAGPADRVRAEILAADGTSAGPAFAAPLDPATKQVQLKATIAPPRLWTAETPNLYTVRVTLLAGDQPVHQIEQRFGFRTIEVRPGDGIYLNGTKIHLKGVDRHCFHPDSGRALSPALSREDAQLIRDMNMNAVRMSHYPPDEHFLDVCDELGLYVLDELAGWHQRYDTQVGAKLVEAMVTRDVNHPCVLFWDNGNEGGWNRELDGLFAQFDPQQRTVLHPWEKFGGINTGHYPTYKSLKDSLDGPDIRMPTEFLHGLYDGGHGAGLADYWELMLSKPKAAGGFLWVLMDEAVKRTDQNGRLDAKGNLAPDGILGPHHEKEGSYFAVKEIWSPARITLPAPPEGFDGSIPVRNTYDFTNLAACRFTWELVKFAAPAPAPAPGSAGAGKTGHAVIEKGDAPSPALPPGAQGTLRLALPVTWPQADALYLSAFDPAGRLLYTWTWPIARAAAYRQRIVMPGTTPVRGSIDGDAIKVSAGAAELVFSATDGRLQRVAVAGKPFSFAAGPTLIADNVPPPPPKPRKNADGTTPPAPPAPPPYVLPTSTPRRVTHQAEGNDYLIRAEFDGPMKSLAWRVTATGWVRLEYTYALAGEFDYFGVGFQYPETKVKGLTWLGGGPYHVWKNRLAGAALDVWHKDYNDSIPGVTWQYPEFKGYHAPFRWAVLETEEGPIALVPEQEDLYLGVYAPNQPKDALSATAVLPKADLSLLHAISPIGNKFTPARDVGPMSQKNVASGTYQGAVWLRFGAAGN